MHGTTPWGRGLAVALGVMLYPGPGAGAEVGSNAAESSAAGSDVAVAVVPELGHAPDEVVVRVERHEPLTAGAARATAYDFRFVPRRTADDLLELVPGVTLVQHGSEGKGQQLFVRGFDAGHGADFELSVQGIPINEWSNIHAQGYLDLGFVIPEVVSSVDVTKGPFSIDQGPFAMAGSAAYTLSVPLTELGGRATLTLGSTNRRRLLATYSPTAGDGTSFIAAELLHDDGFGQNRGIDRGNLLGQLTLLDSERLGTLRALGSVYAARFELPGAVRSDDVEAGRTGFYDVYDRGSGGRSGRILGALSYEREATDHSLRASLYAGRRRLDLLENITGLLNDPVAGDRRAQAQRTWSLGTALDLSFPVAPALRLHAGLGMRGDGFAQRQEHVDASERVLERERGLDGVQALFFAKLGASLEPVPRLRLRGGGRVDVARVAAFDALAAAGRGASGTRVAFSPRLALDTALTPALTLFGAYGRGVRPPEARAFSSFTPQQTGISDDVYGGGEPKMTSTDSFELGARYQGASGRWGAGLAAFATFIERESVYDHVSGVNLELNATRRLGVELDLRARPLGWLDLRAFATLVDARFIESRAPIPLAPRRTAGFQLIGGRDRGPRAGLRGLLVTPRPLPHGARGALLGVLDATLGWHWERLRVDVELENVLGLRLREGEYHFASHFRAGDLASQIPVTHFVAGPPFNARGSATVLF